MAAGILLILQIVLAVTLHMGSRGYETSAPDSLFLEIRADEIDSLSVTDGDGKTLVIEKKNDVWVLPSAFGAPADGLQVAALLEKLTGLKQGFSVATSTGAATRFRVAEDSFERRVTLGSSGVDVAQIYIGTSPAFRQVHARKSGRDEITVIGLNTFELETAVDKWLDKTIAKRDEKDLTAISMKDISLIRDGDAWQLENLNEGELANKEEIDNLVTKVSSFIVQNVLDPEQFADLFSDRPALNFSLSTTAGGSIEYQFFKPEDDFFVLKISDSPLYLKVHSLPVESMQKISRQNLLLRSEGELPGPVPGDSDGQHSDTTN